MKPALIEGATHNPGAPKGMENTCGRLPIRVVRNGDSVFCLSAWRPAPEELAVLLDGGYVVLQVAGWQVPVALSVADRDGAMELA
jgi:hypothetical protein